MAVMMMRAAIRGSGIVEAVVQVVQVVEEEYVGGRASGRASAASTDKACLLAGERAPCYVIA